MADVPNDSTGWVALRSHCIDRADKIPSDDVNLRMRDAEQLTIGDVYKSYIEVRWIDAEGKEHFGPPPMIMPEYDPFEDAIIDRVGGGKAYQVMVRERQRKTAANLATADLTGPSGSSGSSSSSSGSLGSSGLSGSSSSSSGSSGSSSSSGLTDFSVVTVDAAIGPTGAAATGVTGATGIGLTGPTGQSGVDEDATDRWPWRTNPSLRAPEGSIPRLIQLECERLEHEGKLKPSIQHSSITKIYNALKAAGARIEGAPIKEVGLESSLRRAFTGK